MRVQDGQEGWWWWDWPSDQVSVRGPEDRILSLLSRLKFCAWEVFDFLKSQLHSVGSVLFPIAHRFSDCPYRWTWGGSAFWGWRRSIGRKLAVWQSNSGEVKLGERMGEIVRAIDIWVGIIYDTWALKLQPLSTWFRCTSICGMAESSHLVYYALLALPAERHCCLFV